MGRCIICYAELCCASCMPASLYVDRHLCMYSFILDFGPDVHPKRAHHWSGRRATGVRDSHETREEAGVLKSHTP